MCIRRAKTSKPDCARLVVINISSLRSIEVIIKTKSHPTRYSEESAKRITGNPAFAFLPFAKVKSERPRRDSSGLKALRMTIKHCYVILSEAKYLASKVFPRLCKALLRRRGRCLRTAGDPQPQGQKQRRPQTLNKRLFFLF